MIFCEHKKTRILINNIDCFRRSVLLRKIHAWHLQNLDLKASDCFVLHFLAENLPHDVMEQVMEFIAKRTAAAMTMKNDLDMVDNHNQGTGLLKSTTNL